MPRCSELLSTTLANKKIDDDEVDTIREQIYQDGQLDLDDVRLLIELYCEAREYPAAFEKLFFDVLKTVILADGEVSPVDQYNLLKMLYSDRVIRDRELDFLRELKREATHVSPEFETLCQNAFDAHPTNWGVGGR
ncbi:MAG: hypothetical protein IAG10_00620 [Planctomycetaceae bacterium]|nr:hypothetical protein [Planctomycetaceae bacterium]